MDYKISPGTAGNSDIPERYDDLPNHNIEVFQSENIQNILDAKGKNQSCVEIHYEIKKLEKAERQNIKSLLGEEYFELLLKSFNQCESQDIEEQVEKVKLALKNEDKWFSLLITEKNTTGLIGDETGNERGSKYHALMRHTNKSEKDEVSGGTFGKGSSVYTYCSGLWLWFAYTILEKPWNDTRARFIGRGMLAPFTDRIENRSYNGPLWYSRPELQKDYINNNPQQGLPFVNKNAHEEAAKFGMLKREETDPGTTYLIPVFWPEGVDAKEMNAEKISRELKREIIKRWFVPIYNSQLKCFIKISGDTDNNITLTKKELDEIPELKYKLEILEWYNNGADKADKRFKIAPIKVELPLLIKSQQKKMEEKYGKKIGNKKISATMDLVVRVLNEDEKGFKGFLDEEGIGTVNRVALTRNKGMIINHYPYNPRTKQDFKTIAGESNFEAMLFAGRMSNINQPEEVTSYLEMFLSYAENPAHNELIHNDRDLNRCNLKRFEKQPFPAPVSRVKGILDNIYAKIQEFFPKDDKPPAKNEICSFWRKLYKLPSVGNEKVSEPRFNYETLEEGFDKEGRYSWRLKVSSSNPEKKVKLEFGHYLNSHEGAIKTEEEFTNLGVPEFKELLVSENGNLVSEVVLEFDKEEDKGIPRVIEIKTCRITGNNLFKNMDPVLEITDSLIN
ncbi:MAG: hypothetical protein IPJ02_15600 [Chitinophagaceae bacterium]|nr:hypothetical protein [Chitinophagaceae bacterium]